VKNYSDELAWLLSWPKRTMLNKKHYVSSLFSKKLIQQATTQVSDQYFVAFTTRKISTTCSPYIQKSLMSGKIMRKQVKFANACIKENCSAQVLNLMLHTIWLTSVLKCI